MIILINFSKFFDNYYFHFIAAMNTKLQYHSVIGFEFISWQE